MGNRIRKWISVLVAVCLLTTLVLPAGILPASAATVDDDKSTTVYHLRGSELTQDQLANGATTRSSRLLLTPSGFSATANITWVLSFEYYMVEESPIFLYDANSNGQSFYDETTNSRLLQQGRHTFTCTFTYTKNLLPAFFYYYDPIFRAPSDVYIWNVRLTSADGANTKSFTPNSGYLYANNLVTTYTNTAPSTLIGDYADRLAVYELDYTGVASVEDGGSQNPFIQLAPFKTYSPSYIYELSFDYYLPSADTRTYMYMGTSYYKNELGGMTFINEAEGEEHTYLFQQGRHRFSTTIDGFIPTSEMGASLNVCMYQSTADSYTDYKLSKLYIWNVSLTPVAKADGSELTWRENYYYGRWWVPYSANTAATEKMVDKDLLTQKSEVDIIGAQYREDYSLRFVSMVECDGVVRNAATNADYTNSQIVIDGKTYTMTGAGTLFARDVKIMGAGVAEDVLQLGTSNAYVRNIPAEKLLSRSYASDADGIYFTGVIMNIPRDNWDETLSARAYVTYLDEENNEQVWYGDVISRSVTQVKSVIPYDEQNSRYDDQADEMRDSIVNSANTEYTSADGTIYYVSPNGDDSKDGKSPETAWKTLDKVNALSDGTSSAPQVVLFERGGLWRGSIITRKYTTYSAYGTGVKPRFYGSLQNYADASLWTKSETYTNVWEIDTTVNDAFEHIDTASEWGNDIGCIFFTEYIYDEKGNVIGDDVVYWGEKMYYDYDATSPTRPELLEDFQFYHDQLNHKLYLYLELEDGMTPADLSDGIEFAPRYRVVTRNENYTSHNVTVENLCIKYTGSHGIGFGASNYITIRNCEIGWIGGSMHSGKTRFGNGIEIYGNSKGNLIEDNWIYQCFDAGYTNQGGTQSDMEICDNLIEYCNYNLEIWSGTDDGQSMSDCTYHDNLLRFAGYQFERDNRMGSSQSYSAHVYFSMSTAQKKTDVVVENNIMDSTYTSFVVGAGLNSNGMGILLKGNTYVMNYDRLSKVALLADANGVQTKYYGDSQAELTESIKIIDPTYVAAYYDGKVEF